jgi:hypothetical protein
MFKEWQSGTKPLAISNEPSLFFNLQQNICPPPSPLPVPITVSTWKLEQHFFFIKRWKQHISYICTVPIHFCRSKVSFIQLQV